ncbi:uncharacterized protein LOC107806103 [Nicotiana tabacum]|uniref:Protein phosphatase 1 regulatory subunit pprA-like n=1 Tax=Nicotiana tabacum TaxID=4097 RepID=A0A1S4B9X0_TOBAC|nr:PREDICTED: uncharacterized protein LOC107806103 [Nicotiana tabacum]XP_016485701.1 PREDICTED: uncharacterized protein LOC107806103 [Nicotiana tabacum]
MFRFSCFPAHVHSHKQKKTTQFSAEAMHKTLEDCSQNHAMKGFAYLSAASASCAAERDALENYVDHASDSSPLERDNKSEEFKSKSNTECEFKRHNNVQMRKSLSLGSCLNLEGRVVSGNDSEHESGRYSCDESDDRCGSASADGGKELNISLLGLFHEAGPSDSVQVNSDLANNESIFSIGDAKESEKGGQENYEVQLSNANESGDHSPRTTRSIVKSSSLPNIHSTGRQFSHNFNRARSADDLNILDARRKENFMDEVANKVMKDKEKEDSLRNNEKVNDKTPPDDNFDTYNYVGSAKDWILPGMDEVNMKKHVNAESTFCRWNELTGKDFKTKRIEEWVTDLQHCGRFDEADDFSVPDNGPEVQKGKAVLDASPVAKLDGKVNPGAESVKKYISSLSANATSAQLINHGLVVIPFLSAFVSLRALNLSGNSIVRITAGALPRGLHVLNLSRNSISVIEGLRELTRLRVLDLSYNRLIRIGHGLASCSSLKELYLAGNKISEVEGLHRLLKLNVLDLRFNKISTAKCLGQLAANYGSLQAISLEGNPAQKNVGDEQLRKCLQGLLPNLVYFNRKPVKVKDTTDRSARLAIGAHQIDRGLKTDLKAMRKASHSASTHKASSSLTHGRKSQPMTTTKPSKIRSTRLPPSGTKTSSRQHVYDFSSKLLSFRPDLSMRRSRSEGTLGVI